MSISMCLASVVSGVTPAANAPLPRLEEIEFGEDQLSIKHQWEVNQGVLDLLAKAEEALKGQSRVASGTGSAYARICQASAKLRDRQENLLIAVHTDWGVVKNIQRQSQLNAIPAEKRRALTAAMRLRTGTRGRGRGTYGTAFQSAGRNLFRSGTAGFGGGPGYESGRFGAGSGAWFGGLNQGAPTVVAAPGPGMYGGYGGSGFGGAGFGSSFPGGVYGGYSGRPGDGLRFGQGAHLGRAYALEGRLCYGCSKRGHYIKDSESESVANHRGQR